MNFIGRLLENLRDEKLSFRDNIWGVDLADMQSLSKYNKGIKYLLCYKNISCIFLVNMHGLFL